MHHKQQAGSVLLLMAVLGAAAARSEGEVSASQNLRSQEVLGRLGRKRGWQLHLG